VIINLTMTDEVKQFMGDEGVVKFFDGLEHILQQQCRDVEDIKRNYTVLTAQQAGNFPFVEIVCGEVICSPISDKVWDYIKKGKHFPLWVDVILEILLPDGTRLHMRIRLIE
jgi:hypothetical protein